VTSADSTAAEPEELTARLVIVVGLLAVLGPLTIDLYLPAFPQMQQDLGTTPPLIQVTLSAATVGFALGQLVVGPWSDRVGRRTPLLLATAAHVAASVAITASPDVGWVLALRVVQGVGAAGGGVVAVAMIRDVTDGRRLIRGLAHLALFTGIAPVVAPFLGAELMHFTSWRGIFATVAVYGSVMFLLCLRRLPETHPRTHRTHSQSKHAVLLAYGKLLGNARIAGVSLIGGLIVSSVFSYLSTSSFLFQREFGLSPQEYGIISAVNAVAFVVGTQVSAVVAERTSPLRVLHVVLPTMTVTGLGLNLIPAQSPGLYPVCMIMLLFLGLAGACGPCLSAIGLADQAANAGTAAAFMGAVNFGLAGAAAPVVGAFGVSTFGPLGIVIGSVMGSATLVLWLMVARGRSSVLKPSLLRRIRE